MAVNMKPLELACVIGLRFEMYKKMFTKSVKVKRGEAIPVTSRGGP
jgi:hypothetical protein